MKVWPVGLVKVTVDLTGVSRTVVPATTVGMTEGELGDSGTGSWAFHR